MVEGWRVRLEQSTDACVPLEGPDDVTVKLHGDSEADMPVGA